MLMNFSEARARGYHPAARVEGSPGILVLSARVFLSENGRGFKLGRGPNGMSFAFCVKEKSNSYIA